MTLRPPLDVDFAPTSQWLKGYDRGAGGPEIRLEVLRAGESVSQYRMRIQTHAGEGIARNLRAVEIRAKSLLWQIGGERVRLSGCEPLAEHLEQLFSEGGSFDFDRRFFQEVYRDPGDVPVPAGIVGGDWKGCRLGFDLGASDRKCAAVIDGKVVFSEEIRWDPASFKDPSEHFDGIQDSLRRAAAKLPRVDAIGGSTAGIVVGGELRRSSLFRGIPEDRFASEVRPIFRKIRRAWNDVPFAVLNDGAVTALAGSQVLKRRPVLGLALGSSLAAGYVDAEGRLPDTIDELAFVPIDERPDAPVDAWSGGRGCAVRYLSQQGVARLAGRAGIAAGSHASADILLAVQERMASGDEAARKVYESLGVYLGHALAQFSEFYALGTVLLLGRVMSGPGGEVILRAAADVIKTPSISLQTLDERQKRHGQAVAAASLSRGTRVG